MHCMLSCGVGAARSLHSSLQAPVQPRQRGPEGSPKHAASAQAGITLVGLSSVLSGEGSQTHVVSVPQMLLGMGLIVGSQACCCCALCSCMQCLVCGRDELQGSGRGMLSVAGITAAF